MSSMGIEDGNCQLCAELARPIVIVNGIGDGQVVAVLNCPADRPSMALPIVGVAGHIGNSEGHFEGNNWKVAPTRRRSSSNGWVVLCTNNKHNNPWRGVPQKASQIRALLAAENATQIPLK